MQSRFSRIFRFQVYQLNENFKLVKNYQEIGFYLHFFSGPLCNSTEPFCFLSVYLAVYIKENSMELIARVYIEVKQVPEQLVLWFK